METADTCRTIRSSSLWLGYILLLASALLCAGVVEEARPLLPVTRGLIRWWPNPADAHEEVSGQEGHWIGLISDGSDADPYDFNTRPGWLDAGPGVTNASFTLSLWIRTDPLYSVNYLVEQSEGLQIQWSLRCVPHTRQDYVFSDTTDENDARLTTSVSNRVWTHLAITRGTDGAKSFYAAGKRVASAPGTVRPFTPLPGRISIGCNQTGDRQWRGQMHDCALYDRTLADSEIAALASTHIPREPRPTGARTLATATPLPRERGIMRDLWEEDAFLHRRYTSDDGLPGNDVQCVLQASDGHVWAGTKAGLARFDGTRFLSFTPENNAAVRKTGPDMRCLAEDASGTIWAGTFGGLLRFRHDGISAFTQSLPGLFVLRVEPATDGTVWLACVHNGDRTRGPCWVVHYAPDDGRIISKTRAPNQVYDLRHDGNWVWILTESDLLRWDEKTELPDLWTRCWEAGEHPTLRSPTAVGNLRETVLALSSPTRGPFIELSGSGFPGSVCFSVDRAKVIRTGRRMGSPTTEWQGTRDGLFRKSTHGWRRILLGHDKRPHEIYCLAPSQDGGVWFGTGDQDGLHLLVPRDARCFSVNQGLSDAQASSIVQSSDGRIVVGTLNGYRAILDTEVQGLPAYRSESCVSTRMNLVFGFSASAEPSPLHAIWNRNVCEIDLPIGTSIIRASGLLYDREGCLWLCGGNGIVCLSPEAIDDIHRFLSNNGKGVFRVNPTNVTHFKPNENGLPDLDFVGGCEGRDGSVWWGTKRGGIYLYKDGSFSAFQHNQDLRGTDVVPRHQDAEGRLWIASSEGLYCWHSNTLTHLTIRDGLKENLILDIAEDPQRNLWLPGALGVHRITGASLRQRLRDASTTLESITLGTRDGMISPQCSREGWPRTLMTPEGVLWIPTGNGAVSIDTRRIHPDRQAPRVVITEIMTATGPLLGSDYVSPHRATSANLRNIRQETDARPTSLIIPSEGVRALQFQFTALSYGTWENRPIRYRLLGHDLDWSQPESVKTASYPALRPGRYAFEVQAANGYGRWTESATRLELEVLPRLQEQRWFQILIGLLVAAGLASLVTWKIRSERRWAIIHGERRLSAERARIARDMHDELGAGLTQLSLVKSHPEDSGRKARHLLQVLDEIVWTINPRKDTLEATASYLASWAEEFLKDSNVALELDIPLHFGNVAITSELRHELLLCAKESLRNVITHAKARSVKVSIEYKAPVVSLHISDDGCGIAPSSEHASRQMGGNGLNNLKERTSKLGGELVVDSRVGKGTHIAIHLPIHSDTRP